MCAITVFLLYIFTYTLHYQDVTYTSTYAELTDEETSKLNSKISP